MNKQKKLHQRSCSIGHLANNELVQSLMLKLQESQTKIKMLEGYINSLVSKIHQKNQIIQALERSKGVRMEGQHEQAAKMQERDARVEEGLGNALGESIQDITNVDQNELNIKNRMESMKPFQINKMPTLFQRNINLTPEKMPRVVSHSRILQLKPSNIRSRLSPTNLIPIKDQLPIKQQPHIDTPLRLFENFLVVSGNVEGLERSMVLEPKIMCACPGKVSADRERAIALFCFPNKVQCGRVEGEQKQGEAEESSIFVLNSEYTTANKTNKTISYVNPNHYLYGICMSTSSIIKTNGILYKVPATYVILTYFPFVTLFNQILLLAIKSCKTQHNIAINQKHLRESLRELNDIRIRTFPAVMKCNIFNRTQSICFPQSHHVDSLALSYFNACISKLTHHILADLLLYFLLQYSIIVYSSNKTLKSQVILLLLQIIKPLKYPYPIITDLPPEMQPMLDSPFPCVLGVGNELEANLSECHVYLNLDSKKLTTKSEIKQLHYVFDYTRDSIRSKFANESEVVKRLKYLVREEILNGKDKRSIMAPFLERFKNTQIYKYNHQ